MDSMGIAQRKNRVLEIHRGKASANFISVQILSVSQRKIEKKRFKEEKFAPINPSLCISFSLLNLCANIKCFIVELEKYLHESLAKERNV